MTGEPTDDFDDLKIGPENRTRENVPTTVMEGEDDREGNKAREKQRGGNKGEAKLMKSKSTTIQYNPLPEHEHHKTPTTPARQNTYNRTLHPKHKDQNTTPQTPQQQQQQHRLNTAIKAP